MAASADLDYEGHTLESGSFYHTHYTCKFCGCRYSVFHNQPKENQGTDKLCETCLKIGKTMKLETALPIAESKEKIMSTTIEWVKNPDGTKGEVWNPVTGCTKVSQGCKHCYAERIANRFWGERKFTDVICHTDRLEIPLKWRKPRRVFVNSMSDLFHASVPDEFIAEVFRIMERTPQHTYQILTKRPETMRQWFITYNAEKPLPNVWLGISAEDQSNFMARYSHLAQTPAAVRFVSFEPMLGPVDLMGATPDWVICGGESGPGARPMHPRWAWNIKDQCQAAGVPFFFKQWGEWAQIDRIKPEKVFSRIHPADEFIGMDREGSFGDGFVMARVGKKRAGRTLEGRYWSEYPEKRK